MKTTQIHRASAATRVAALAVLGWTLFAAGQDGVPPPAPQSPREMPAKYSALLYRSIFTRDIPRWMPGDSIPSLPGYPPRPPTTPTSGPTTNEAPPGVLTTSPESALSLRGVVQWGDSCVAFVEDAYTGKTLNIKEGDLVARGKITKVTLHGLDYQALARTQHVNEGENLLGMVVAPPSEPAPYGAPPPSTSGGAPGYPPPPYPSSPYPSSPYPASPSAASSSAAPAPPPLPPGDSIEERMRRRRQAESGR